MNQYQELWWQQAKADYDIFLLLRRDVGIECHQLQFLQMATEKLGKAYFWRSEVAPPKSHTGFHKFMRNLGSIADSRRQEKILKTLSFPRLEDFQKWLKGVLPIVYDLQNCTPDLSRNGPNPEYPWPHEKPTENPLNHTFEIWRILSQTGRGRQLLQVIEDAISRFPDYG